VWGVKTPIRALTCWFAIYVCKPSKLAAGDVHSSLVNN
jgi:hypothetical protein